MDDWATQERETLAAWRAQLEQHLEDTHGFGVDDLPGWRWEEGAYEGTKAAVWCAQRLSKSDICLASFLGNPKLSKSTRTAYRQDLGMLANHLGVPLRDAVRDWLSRSPAEGTRIAAQIKTNLEERSLSSKTIVRKLRTLQRLADRALRAGVLGGPIWVPCPPSPPHEPREVPEHYNADTVERLVGQLMKSERWTDWRLAVAVSLVWDQSLGGKELLQLRSEDVRLDRKPATIRVPYLFCDERDGHEWRRIEELARAALEHWLREVGPGDLMRSPDSTTAVGSRQLMRHLSEACRRLGVESIELGLLRQAAVKRDVEQLGPGAGGDQARTRSYGSMYNIARRAEHERRRQAAVPGSVSEE